MPFTSRRRVLHALAGLTAAASLATGFGTTAPADAAPETAQCTNVSIPVTLDRGLAAQLAGTLCAPQGATSVAVLVPGITYTRQYWDFPYRPDIYSFVRVANQAGIATLALDKLGTGASTRPASSAQVTLPHHVSALHQVIHALRTGTLGSGYRRVVTVGHSYGSVIAYTEAGQYRDVDALVTTGISHQINLAATVDAALLKQYPAMLDPRFAGTITDPGYLTTRPGQRSVFYSPSSSDPAVIAEDDRLKDVYSVSDLATYLPEYLNPSSRGYDGPVLVVGGEKDQIMCGISPLGAACNSGAALAASEKPFYGTRAQVEGVVVPGTGHDLALSTTAHESDRQIVQWITHR